MAYLKGTLIKLGTRTAHYTFPWQRRLIDILIPWWPLRIKQKHETKHYYILKANANGSLRSFNIPLPFMNIRRWKFFGDYDEHLLTFTEVHRYMMEGDYDNYVSHYPEQFIGKEVEVWTKEVDHKHFGFTKEHYPFKIEEVK